MKMKQAAGALLVLSAVLSSLFALAESRADDDVWQEQKAAPVSVTLDVTLGVQRYSSAMSSIQREIGLTTTKPHLEKKPILGKQTATPTNWLHVVVKGSGAQSTLAIRLDTLYLVGFKTGATWYAFKGREHLIKEGATALAFGDDYTALTGKGGYKNLKHVSVGQKAAAEALATLASYTHGGQDEEVKKALVTFVLMLCESSRFTLVRTEVVAAWDKGGTLGDSAIALTVIWKEVSCALLRWSSSKKWDSSDAKKIENMGDPKIKDPATAAANIYCILQVAGC